MAQACSATLASPTTDEKRQAALAYLGANYVLHRDYRPDPRHSNNPGTYVRARQPYLLAIRMAAEADRRSKNQPGA